MILPLQDVERRIQGGSAAKERAVPVLPTAALPRPLRGAPTPSPPRCGSSPGRASRWRHRRATVHRRRGSSPGPGLPCQNLQSRPVPPQMVLYSGHSGQSAPRSAWITESNSSNMANNESGAWNETIWVGMKGCGAAPDHHLDAVDALGRSVLLSDFYLVFCEPVVCPSSGPRSLPATIFLWRLPEIVRRW